MQPPTLSAIPFTKTHYDELVTWWNKRQFPAIPYDCLPSSAFIVEGYAFAALYKTNSKICWTEWLTSNPSQGIIERQRALDLCIEAALRHAKERGFSLVFTSINNPILQSRYESHGFQVSETEMTNMIRRL